MILVDERARVAGYIADRCAGHPVGVVQAIEAGAAQDAVDGRTGIAGQRGQAGRTIASTGTGSDDRRGHRVGRAAGRAEWPGAPILEARQAVGAIAADPLVTGRSADPELLGHRGHWPAVDHDPLDQKLTTKDGEPRSRMCHESLRPMWVLNTSHRVAGLSFVNNVFGHHS